MKNVCKKLVACALALCMVLGLCPAISVGANAAEPELNIQVTYDQNGYTFEKVSHASSPTETADGVVDYLGDHLIAPYVDGESETGNGDSVQSYSYCAVAYGDWVYMGTMYGALSAAAQIKNALPAGTDPAIADAVVNAMYNGKLNRGQEYDGYYAGSVFFKFNVKTAETVILMSRPMFEQGQCSGVPIFRAACEYNGKLYFVGLVSNGTALDRYNGMPLTPAYALNLEIRMQTGVPSIFELDPETDELTKVYEAVDVEGYRALNGAMDGKSVFTSTRAIGTYQDYLIAGGIQIDARYPEGRPDGYAPGDACLVATNNPSEGFKVIATMGDLYDYPAIWRDGSSGGGGIYQVVEYNGSLYVAIVSGTKDTQNEVTGQFRPFAVVRGDYDETKGTIDQREAWTWTPVIGNQQDGAKYTFGIDPERTASSACTLQPYGGYLYIGEYNDVNGSLAGILQRKDFNTLAANLDQSINLYRMDENEEIEMVVGDATEMFPEGSLSGWGSGYATHMTQYTWMTTVYDGIMYLSTMDETSLTRPIADVVSGEWVKMSPEEWESQLNYLKVLLELLFAEEQPGTGSELVQRAEAIVASGTAAQTMGLRPAAVLTEEQRAQLIADLESGAVVPGELLDMENRGDLDILLEGLELLEAMLTSTDSEEFLAAYNELMELYESSLSDLLPDAAKQIIEMLLNYATRENLTNLATCLGYMRQAEAGFDLYAITQYEDDSVQIVPVTTNGFNDRYNHGLRIFAATTDYMAIGTANPFFGTQIWRMSEHPDTPDGHDWSDWESVTEATCFVDGEEMRTCLICGETETREVPANSDNCPSAGFTDVKETSWHHEGVDYVVANGIMLGTAADKFSPAMPLTRAQLMTVLYRLAGEPEVEGENAFADVKAGAWYETAVIWGTENGITNGTGIDTFSPNKDVTRQDMVVMLYRYAQLLDLDTTSSEEPDFPDADKVSAYAHDAMAWAVSTGLIGGVETNSGAILAPRGTTTRAQFAVVIMRFDEYNF